MNYLTVSAARLAVLAHGSQKYGDKPYATHLQSVVDSVTAASGSTNSICVAWLHDILEDTDCTVEYLQQGFPQEVVDAVIALTKVKGEEYSAYLDKVAANKIALVVKMHDTLCNLTESLRTEQWSRVRKYSEQMKLLANYK